MQQISFIPLFLNHTFVICAVAIHHTKSKWFNLFQIRSGDFDGAVVSVYILSIVLQCIYWFCCLFMFVFTCLCDVLYGMSENYMLDCFRTRVPEEDKGDYILRQESERDSGIDLHQICHRDLVIRNCMIKCLSCVNHSPLTRACHKMMIIPSSPLWTQPLMSLGHGRWPVSQYNTLDQSQRDVGCAGPIRSRYP